jgi:Ribbon-helix-helix protein, copG family
MVRRLPAAYDMAMARSQTLVQLTRELVDLLDRRAARDGVSRSQVIRDAVSAYLRDEQETEITRRIVEGYQRRPQESDADSDEWGDLGALADFAARETLTQLRAEEADG